MNNSCNGERSKIGITTVSYTSQSTKIFQESVSDSSFVESVASGFKHGPAAAKKQWWILYPNPFALSSEQILNQHLQSSWRNGSHLSCHHYFVTSSAKIWLEINQSNKRVPRKKVFRFTFCWIHCVQIQDLTSSCKKAMLDPIYPDPFALSSE